MGKSVMMDGKNNRFYQNGHENSVGEISPLTGLCGTTAAWGFAKIDRPAQKSQFKTTCWYPMGIRLYIVQPRKVKKKKKKKNTSLDQQNNNSVPCTEFKGRYIPWLAKVTKLTFRTSDLRLSLWQRASARKVCFIIFLQWKFNPSQLIWYQFL